jgi:hypothetical protein
LGLSLALLAPAASQAQTSGYVVPPCTGDPNKDTPVLKDAFARGGTILLPPCEYRVAATLRLKSGTILIGSGYSKSLIFSVITDGRPTIDSDPAVPLTGVYLADFHLKGKYGNGVIGVGDGMQLYGVTDSAFVRLKIGNFRGNGFAIKKPTGRPEGLVRTHFDSIFGISIGTYAFDIDGTVDAAWNMIDINSSSTGAYRFRAGSSSAPRIEITGFIAEWHKSYSSKDHIVLFDNPNGQSIRFRGCAASTFSGTNPANLSFLKSSGTVKVEFLGCTGGAGSDTGGQFKNWITSPSRTVAYMPRINSVY